MRWRTSAILMLVVAVLSQVGAPAALGQQQGTRPTTSTPTVPGAPAPTTSTAAPNAPAPQPAPAPSAAPDPRIGQAAQAPDDSGAPPVVVALGVLGALLLLGLALWGLLRWSAWEPRWAPRWRHAAAEAGWRASLGWADFRDWLRLGR